MKKKYLISCLLALILLFMASTAFAYTVSTTSEKSAGSWYVSLNMYGKNVCTSSKIDGAGCFHKVYLKQGSSQSSSLLTVENGGPGGTVNIYPWTGGTHNLIIYNYYYYGMGTLTVNGSFSGYYI